MSVSGDQDLYYVRAQLVNASAGGYQAPSRSSARIKTDILLFQYCGDVTTAAATFDVRECRRRRRLKLHVVHRDSRATATVARRVADGVGACRPGLPPLPWRCRRPARGRG